MFVECGPAFLKKPVTRNILIIGSGPAAVFAAIAAKRQDPAADVVLLTDEGCEPYEKPPLSKAVLLGKSRPEDTPIAGKDGVAARGVTVQFNTPCTAIDRAARMVMTQRGPLPYDALVIATGSLMRELPLLPPGMPRVHYLRTDAEARALKADLATCRHLAVIGAGLIGLEVAASAAELGIKVTVIELAPRIMARACDEETGALVLAEHQRHGVDIRLAYVGRAGDTAIGRATRAHTDNGDGHRCRPGRGRHRRAAEHGTRRSSRARGAGRHRRRRAMPHLRSDHFRGRRRNALSRAGRTWCGWRTGAMPRTMARPPAGMPPARPRPIAWRRRSGRSNMISTFRASAGRSRRRRRIRRKLAGKGTLLLETSDGVLTHAIGINAQRDLAVIRRLIERRVPVDPAALADPGQPFACESEMDSAQSPAMKA